MLLKFHIISNKLLSSTICYKTIRQ